MKITRILLALAAAVAIPAQAALVKSPRLISGTSVQACWSEAVNFDVVVKACDPDDATQQVEATKGTAAGFYKFRFRSGRCAGVRSATVAVPAEKVATRACSANTGDEFKLRRFSGSANYKIQSRLGSLVAGTQASPASGLAVDMYTDASSDTQDWLLVEHVNRARPTDSAVRTTLGKAFNAKLSGSTVLPTTEVDLTDCEGLICRVAGSNPARYAPAKAFVPGMIGADLVNTLAIEETSPPVTVTVATPAAISGTPEENQTISLTAATFANYTGSVVNTLRRGSAAGVVIATGVTTYTMTAADVGQSLYYVSVAGTVTSQANTAVVAAASTGSNWTGGIVAAAFSGLTNSGPITATTNQVIQGRNISNPNGTCIVIPDGVTGVTIRGNNIGPCERVTLNNGDGAGMAVHIRGGSGHTVEANYIRDSAIAVMLQGTGANKVQRNRLHNIYGGNLAAGGSRYLPGIQFNAMTGTAGRSLVACNVMDASTWTITPTSTRPGIEDGFSTNGSSNVTYRHNWIRGNPSAGYNSPTGSCISLGDDSGNNNQARDNVCVRTPNHGIFTAGGDSHLVENNIAYEIGVAGSNTGLSFAASEFQGQESKSVLFRANRGYASYWNNGGTGTIDSWGSFFAWVAGRDATPDRSIDGLVLYGNNFRDTTLTEASAWGTTYAACNGTGSIPSGDIAFPQISQTIPLQSTITAATTPYPRFAPANFQGKVKFEIFNNDWASSGNGGNNTINNSPGWSQSVGLEGMQPNHTVNVRLKWSYPQSYAGQEVLNFPGFGEGRQAATSAATPQAGAKLPAQISSITSYRTGYASAAGPMSGPAHLSYDLWVGGTPTTSHATGTVAAGTYNPNRDAEIMMPRRISRAYGVPNTPAGAAAGRGCANLDTAATTCGGRNPAIWVERATIGGQQWDVYHADPYPLPWYPNKAFTAGQRLAPATFNSSVVAWAYNGYIYTANGACTSGATLPSWPTTAGATVVSGGCTFTAQRVYWTLPWHFIVFQPLNAPGAAGDVIEWKTYLDYIGGKGWIANWSTRYLNAMEIGVEPINPASYDLATGGTTGDIQLMGFWTELNGARY